MPALYFDDFTLGQRFVTPARTIAEADVVLFAGISGDYNPLHTDAVFAREAAFGERVAHGLLGLAILSGLKQRLGISEGTVMAFLGLSWDFRAPIHFGDTVHGEIEVVELREAKRADRGIVHQRVRLVNQNGEVVQEGIHKLMVRRRG